MDAARPLSRRRCLQGLAGATLWPCIAPAARAGTGWNTARLAEADRVARELDTAAWLVWHRGAPVHVFGDVAQPLPCYSVRKSVLGVLYGLAVARGRIDLQATLGQLGIDDEQGLTAQEKTATVQQLLQARSGVYHPAAYETAGMAATRPPRGSHAPGTHWYYNNWDFNALGSIYRQATGRDVFEGLAEEIAAPLGWTDFDPARHTRWVVESASRHGAYTMELSARDLARLGHVMACGGRLDDRAWLPEAWVDDSTRAWSVEPPGWQGYGYLWWVPQRAWPFWTRKPGQFFFAHGNHDQAMWVDRGRQIVVVHRRVSRFWRQPVGLNALSPFLRAVFEAAPASS